MSQATKRKHVVQEVLGDHVTPTGRQQIVRVLGSPGNNLHEAETAQGERFLVSMPTKFRKNIWIKRGDYLIVEPIEEGEKVKGEIIFILYKDHIRQLRKEGAWPAGFPGEEAPGEERAGSDEGRGGAEGQRGREEEEEEEEEEDGSTDSEDDGDLFVNTNRVNYHYSESEGDSDSEGAEEEEEDGSEGKD
nr:PREDICTED: probable RNA-binding protein EIF1AD isoform X1 [Lepisosteus oculatus]XP_015194328.1 PREDICTED: probable RNA-binding protein EIF1AD isoform X1 [Lepisosteus oculatus]